MPEAPKAGRVAPAARGRGLLVAIVCVSLAGAGIWYWSSRGADPAEAEGGTRIKSTLHLETFVLNLADPDQKSYLRVGVDLGLSRELKREEPPPVAKVRDTILAVLGESKVEELLTAPGKEQLKEKLLHALQQRAPELGVEEVYFTEFLIQR